MRTGRGKRVPQLLMTVVLVALLPSALAQDGDAPLPLAVHAGVVTELERIDTEVPWVRLDSVLIDDLYDPETTPETARIKRPPAAQHCYAAWTLQVTDGRSVSRFDYRTRYDGGVAPCIAMRRDSRPFDSRNQTFKGPEDVTLIFEVPTAVTALSLEFALPTTVPQPSARDVPFGDQPAARTQGGDSDETVNDDPDDDPDDAAEAEEQTPAAGATDETDTGSDSAEREDPKPKPEPKPPPDGGDGGLGDLF